MFLHFCIKNDVNHRVHQDNPISVCTVFGLNAKSKKRYHMVKPVSECFYQGVQILLAIIIKDWKIKEFLPSIKVSDDTYSYILVAMVNNTAVQRNVLPTSLLQLNFCVLSVALLLCFIRRSRIISFVLLSLTKYMETIVHHGLSKVW